MQFRLWAQRVLPARRQGPVDPETPTGSVRLQNAARRVATLIGNPLRASAQIYNEDELAFAGFVSAISYGLMIDLTLES